MHRPLTVLDRVAFGAKGAVAGLPLGVLGWWLYGMAHSLNYHGLKMDPILVHWLTWMSAVMAVLGIVFGPLVGLAIRDTLLAAFHFEIGTYPRNPSAWLAIVLLSILAAAIWFSTPNLAHATR